MQPASRETSASSHPSKVSLAKRADFELGGTRVYPSRLLLETPGIGAVPVERLVMEVLLAFVEAEGAVLSRDELLRRCWPGVVVGDDAVHRVIAGLRKAAAATGGSFAIETIPRVGYRLELKTPSGLSPVEPKADGAEPLEKTNAAATADPERYRVSRRWLLAGGAAALSVGAVAWWRHGTSNVDPVARHLVEQ